MNDQNFATAFSVDQTQMKSSNAITNVHGWWSEDIEGGTDKLGAQFTYRFKDVHHSKMRLTWTNAVISAPQLIGFRGRPHGRFQCCSSPGYRDRSR
jgi:hypothetical protein